ncbi:MAG: hypothetical protein AAF571_05240 [Verrucomicrobiota bacterium]
MREQVQQIRTALPEQGLFSGQEWRLSADALELSRSEVRALERLGVWLAKFQKTANSLYRRSVNGSAPAWIAEYLDRGKPPELIAASRSGVQADALPTLIRPDLILTETGFALTEIDSVPGGTGLTSWMQETYRTLGEPVIGDVDMRDVLRSRFAGYDIVISEEAYEYRPELDWLYGEENVHRAENYLFNGKPVYRFFEGFDWPILDRLRESHRPECIIDAPLKPFLEEKLWMALFWMKPLESFWRQELGSRYFQELRKIIPYTWMMEPMNLPPGGVIPGLEIHHWDALKAYSQKQRDYILKISGFSPLAWGSRGVTVGTDVSAEAWGDAIDHALTTAAENPYILQPFHKGRRLKHRFWDEDLDEEVLMEGRVRLCPYYLQDGKQVRLLGVQATICPADKKLIHGMSDAIIVPVKQQLAD